VSHNLKSLNIHEVEDVRIGKHITLTLEAETEEAARETVDNACRKLLANLIMENFVFELTAIE
jgi:phosphoribosylformylglycinamidine synthase